MSEPIPESIPTSADPRSKQPTKKRALSPTSSQSAQLQSLFADPSKPIALPLPTSIGKRNGHAPPEIVANVQGSSAGAGSGEFHVYKASRRREYERLRAMDEDLKREKGDEDWLRRREEVRRRDEEKAGRARAKREKLRARKAKGKAEGDDDGDGGGEGDDNDGGGGGGGVRGKRVTIGAGRSPAGPEGPPREDDDDGVVDGSGMPLARVEPGVVIYDED